MGSKIWMPEAASRPLQLRTAKGLARLRLHAGSPEPLLVAYKCMCLFVLRFYGPVNPMGSCRARSVYLTTRLLDGRWSRCYSYSLLLCGLFYEAICCMSFHVSFCSWVFLVLLVLRLPRLGKRDLILVLFVRLFDLCLFGCRFSIPLGVGEGLRFVIVALPGLFSYLFLVL